MWDMPASEKNNNILLRNDPQRHLRSSSPAVKRPASDMGAQDREDHLEDVDVEDGGAANPSASKSEHNTKAKMQNTGQRQKRRGSSVVDSHSGSSETGISSEESGSSNSVHNHALSASTAETSIISMMDQNDLPSTYTVPPIDEQVNQIIQLIEKPATDKQKGFAVSTKWLYKVVAKSSVQPIGVVIDKSFSEGEIGPVDSSDLLIITEDTGLLKDEIGQLFVPVRPGLILGQDFRVLPEEGWNLVTRWYGHSGPIITRFAHKTSSAEHANCEYEIYPPIFSILKVPASTNVQIHAEQRQPPVRMLAPRETLFQDWLRHAKDLLHIQVTTKVRPWKIRGGLKNTNTSGMLTPAASRSASPAPGADIVASAGDSVIVDVNSFAALQIGEQRELVEQKDETANENYNGKSLTLNVAGMSRDEVIALEESGEHGDWASSKLKTNFVAGKGSLGKSKNLPSGRLSPAPGMMTRGRQRRDDRPKGITGLSNLGNTCYMNSALQSLRSVQELTVYFLKDYWKEDLNEDNPLGHHGQVAKAYADLLKNIYEDGQSSFSPSRFKNIIGRYGPSFAGYGQQDSQEFLLFLLDGLQEDLNRVKQKPYIEKPDSTDEMVHNYQALKDFADKNWVDYKARNDSVVTDLFAGLYKSTVTCPVCDKVSIIFDPFSNLTLQLPVDNVYTQTVIYFPLLQKPIKVEVEVDRMGSIKDIKRFVAQRMQTDVNRLLMSEIYRNRFYKMFNNTTAIAEASIQKNDVLAVFELAAIATNYQPDKPRRASMGLSFMTSRNSDDIIVDDDSADADRLLVPVFHRRPKGSTTHKQFFAEAGYVVLDRNDRRVYDRLLQKILAVASTLTTKQILTEADPDSTPEDSDTVLVTADDESSASTNVQLQPVGGDESLMDVSMADNAPIDQQSAALPHVLKPGVSVPPVLRNLFAIKTVLTKENVPTGWNDINDINDYDLVPDPASRSVSPRTTRRFKGLNVVNRSSDPDSVSSDDDDIVDIPHDPIATSSTGSKLDSDDQNGSRSEEDSSAASIQSVPNSEPKPLIMPGNALILDWTAEAYDALFTGKANDEWKGAATAEPQSSIPVFSDPELAAKKESRNRKRRNGITLEDCLNEFGKSETLSENNAWYCPRCKEHRRADKRFEVWKAPDILVMHLKRFSSHRSWRDKLEVMVDYPTEGLDMSGRVLDKEPEKSLIYDLIAVDNHYGGLGGGHYTAFAKNFYNGSWYEYNGKASL